MCVCVCLQDEDDRDCYTHTVQPLPGVRAFARMVCKRVVKETFYSGKAHPTHTDTRALHQRPLAVSCGAGHCLLRSARAPAHVSHVSSAHMCDVCMFVCAGESDEDSSSDDDTCSDDYTTVSPKVPHRLSRVTY